MSHTHQNKKKLLSRVKRIKGQIEGVEKMLESERDCYEILQTISACRGAINGLFSEVFEGHIRFHIIEESTNKSAAVKQAGNETIAIVKSFLK